MPKKEILLQLVQGCDIFQARLTRLNGVWHLCRVEAWIALLNSLCEQFFQVAIILEDSVHFSECNGLVGKFHCGATSRTRFR